jgi:hypothetical protein
VIVGQSFSGGAATIAAVTNPDLVSAIVEIDPFTRPPKISVAALLRNTHNYRRGALLLGQFVFTGSVEAWSKYLDVAYPGRKPADWDTWLAPLQANLREPGRVKAAKEMANSKPSKATLKDAAAQLANVRCPALVIMGRDDSDFPDPEAEAAAIVGLLPPGLGRYEMIDNAGHYPHAQYRSKSQTPFCRSSPRPPMPRAGLNPSEVVASAAELADETGSGSVSLAALAGRLGVNAPALYKHVDGIGELARDMCPIPGVPAAPHDRCTIRGPSRCSGPYLMSTTN